MRNHNHLNDYRHKVDLFLDNALTSEESQEVINKSNNNATYKAVLDKEKNFRNLIRDKVQRTTCSDHLIKNILDKVKL